MGVLNYIPCVIANIYIYIYIYTGDILVRMCVCVRV